MLSGTPVNIKTNIPPTEISGVFENLTWILPVTTEYYLAKTSFQDFLDRLRLDGYEVHGPVVRDNAIVYELLSATESLPIGYRDQQSPGSYRLSKSDSPGDKYWFAWANGPQALKPYVFAPRESLWRAEKPDGHRVEFKQTLPSAKAKAILGVRACDLAALAIHDQHFLDSDYPDPQYHRRREDLFLIAVNCSHPASTCFCAATGDGPRARAFNDLALTELETGFVVTVGSERGQHLVQALRLPAADSGQVNSAAQIIEEATSVQQRKLPAHDIPMKLLSVLDDSYWQEIAQRCLSCSNCTSVCPTCFCYREKTETAVDLQSSDQFREWDSCFNQGHSYMHGITIRADTRSRYLQWLTHKFGTWNEQFGRSGCVGCGRCISWCPAGIDIGVELNRLCS